MKLQFPFRIHAHNDDVNAVSFVDDRTHILASGGDDGLCKVYQQALQPIKQIYQVYN